MKMPLRVKDVDPGVAASALQELTSLGHLLCFVSDACRNGGALMISDRTAAGTRLVKDLVPGWGGSMPMSLRQQRTGRKAGNAADLGQHLRTGGQAPAAP